MHPTSILYHTSVTSVAALPKDGKPQIAICGRSNVGKSSLINAVFNKKNLAKVSSTPGKTRMLNFFLVNQLFYLVDLPGYGYAKVSKEEQDAWAKFIQGYFYSSPPIALVLHLIDCRHTPGTLDMSFDSFITEMGFPQVKILTKADKLKQSEKSKNKKMIMSNFPQCSSDQFLLTSSEGGEGIKEMRLLILKAGEEKW